MQMTTFSMVSDTYQSQLVGPTNAGQSTPAIASPDWVWGSGALKNPDGTRWLVLQPATVNSITTRPVDMSKVWSVETTFTVHNIQPGTVFGYTSAGSFDYASLKYLGGGNFSTADNVSDFAFNLAAPTLSTSVIDGATVAFKIRVPGVWGTPPQAHWQIGGTTYETAINTAATSYTGMTAPLRFVFKGGTGAVGISGLVEARDFYGGADSVPILQQVGANSTNVRLDDPLIFSPALTAGGANSANVTVDGGYIKAEHAWASAADWEQSSATSIPKFGGPAIPAFQAWDSLILPGDGISWKFNFASSSNGGFLFGWMPYGWWALLFKSGALSLKQYDTVTSGPAATFNAGDAVEIRIYWDATPSFGVWGQGGASNYKWQVKKNGTVLWTTSNAVFMPGDVAVTPPFYSHAFGSTATGNAYMYGLRADWTRTAAATSDGHSLIFDNPPRFNVYDGIS